MIFTSTQENNKKKLNQRQNPIKQAFQRVKQDLLNVRLWIDFFLKKTRENEVQHSLFEHKNRVLEEKVRAIEEFLKQQNDFNTEITSLFKDFSQKINSINKRIDHLETDIKGSISESLEVEVQNAINKVNKLNKQDIIALKNTYSEFRELLRSLNKRVKKIEELEENLKTLKQTLSKNSVHSEKTSDFQGVSHSNVPRTHKGHVKDKSGQVGTFKDMSLINQVNKDLKGITKNLKQEISDLTQTDNIKEHLRENLLTRDIKESDLLESKLSNLEEQLLRVLLNTTRPLSYLELSRITGRQEKTIRNTIYSLRKKGFVINDKVVPPRIKVFYLPEHIKLLLSGR